MPFQPTYSVSPERQAYTLPAGSSTGCLILHGFMGSPISSRPMADHLAAQGITVHCPLLPGHGDRPDKLYQIPHTAWIGEAQEALHTLRRHSRHIFIVAHSMGTVLAALLAEKNQDIHGLTLIAPLYNVPSRAIQLTRYLRPVVPWFYPWRFKRLQKLVKERILDLYPDLDLNDPAVQQQLPQLSRVPTSGIDEMRKMADIGRPLWPKLRLPIIVLQGGHDVAVRPGNSEALFATLGSPNKQFHAFPHAGHELMRPFDPVHQEVWQLISNFIKNHTPVDN